MSEENISSDLPGTQAISLSAVGGSAQGELKQFLNDFEAAIKKAPEGDNKNAAKEALNTVGQELGQLGVNAPKDASITHVDHQRKNNALAERFAFGAEVVSALTGNPIVNQTARLISQILSSQEEAGGLDKLAQVAKAAGIKTVGTLSLDTAIENAKANAGTLKAIHSLRKNGFSGDTLYASSEDLAANGGGKAGEKNFIRVIAQKQKDNAQNGADHDLSKVFAKPVAPSKAQIDDANGAGQNLKGGISGEEAKKAKASASELDRQTVAGISVAAKNSAPSTAPPVAPPVRRQAGPQLKSVLNQKFGYDAKPKDINPSNDSAIAQQIKDMEKGHQERMRELDTKAQEIEALKKNAEASVQRPGTKMSSVPILTPNFAPSGPYPA